MVVCLELAPHVEGNLPRAARDDVEAQVDHRRDSDDVSPVHIERPVPPVGRLAPDVNLGTEALDASPDARQAEGYAAALQGHPPEARPPTAERLLRAPPGGSTAPEEVGLALGKEETVGIALVGRDRAVLAEGEFAAPRLGASSRVSCTKVAASSSVSRFESSW
jgi:hypothetical protein